MMFSPSATLPPGDNVLELQLVGPTQLIVIGQRLNFSVRAKNQTREPIRLVAETIGFTDLRYPTSILECRAVNTKSWIDVSQHPTCGNTNPINAQEFFEVQPGKSGTWGGQLFWNDQLKDMFEHGPRTYEFRLTYRTDAAIDQWIGGPMPEPQNTLRRHEIESYWDQVPKGVFVSKAVKVRFSLLPPAPASKS